MHKDDVPQDKGVLGQWHEISYAVDQDGKYVKVPSSGWEPANIANELAWQQIDQQIEEIRHKVKGEELSPLAYYMAKNNMDVGLLSQYTGLPKRKIRYHLTAKGFRDLKERDLKRYADALAMSVDEFYKAL